MDTGSNRDDYVLNRMQETVREVMEQRQEAHDQTIRMVEGEDWRTFKVGDIVTRDGSDRQEITEINDAGDLITVVCVGEPAWFNDGDTLHAPWCRLGEEEQNMAWRYTYAGQIIEGVVA